MGPLYSDHCGWCLKRRFQGLILQEGPSRIGEYLNGKVDTANSILALPGWQQSHRNMSAYALYILSSPDILRTGMSRVHSWPEQPSESCLCSPVA